MTLALKEPQRELLEEIARIASGGEITQTQLENAFEMIKNARGE